MAVDTEQSVGQLAAELAAAEHPSPALAQAMAEQLGGHDVDRRPVQPAVARQRSKAKP